MIAGLLKGPSYYNPDRHPDRAKARLTYVLDRMKDDGFISDQQKEAALAAPPKLAPFVHVQRDSGFNFVDYLGHEAKSDGVDSLTAAPYSVHSTIDAKLQQQTEGALQEGLARYEISTGRMEFHGPEANIAEAVRKLGAGSQTGTPAWQTALQGAHLPLYDVHWTPAVVLDKGSKAGGVIHVGLPDGRVMPLTTYTAQIRRGLDVYDVVYVHVVAARARVARSGGRAVAAAAHAEIRVRPRVQGAALVLENKTGRILAMAGGFSYPLSQLNRTWQTERQPGSAIKPITYLTALQKGLQPNTLVPNEPITLPPIGSANSGVVGGLVEYGGSERDSWSPRNDDFSTGGLYTLRRGLEYSVNLVTAHLIDGAIDPDPQSSLDDVCATAVAAKIYTDCVRYYPFVLGAQPVRMINLAAFYAAVANEGVRAQPHAIDSIELGGKSVYQYSAAPALTLIGAADRASFFQLKTLLQGVVARGTARSIAALSPYVAGKTGTTEDAVDAWFVGFTNDVTVAIWVGYDNGDGKRRSLGRVDGAHVAVPIFAPIIEDVWADKIAPKAPLAGPSPEAARQLVALPINYVTGEPARGGGGNLLEYFRLGSDGHVADTQYQLVPPEEAADERYQAQYPGDYAARGDEDGSQYYAGGSGRSYYPRQGWQSGQPQPQPQQQQRGLFSLPWGDDRQRQPQPMARGLFGPWPWGQ
jgi:membrane carboxypeptidase/penicillin-binding protein